MKFKRRIIKAAPRFELGIKDLQSSALPLGHAANGAFSNHHIDRNSNPAEILLVISNGHGEDLIALRVITELHKLNPNIAFKVLPLVGEGKIFLKAIQDGWIEQVGFFNRLPSGGFSNQSVKAFFADIFAGLFTNTWNQWKIMRAQSNSRTRILAVGDLLPLLFAWSSGIAFAFIGTPKSDYTWRSGPFNSFSDYYHRIKGSEWDPWECLIMKSSMCKLVAVRDKLTARGLRSWGVTAQSFGNPMMDGFSKTNIPTPLMNYRRLILLCGSRSPEALRNFLNLIQSLNYLNNDGKIAIFVALGGEPKYTEIENILIQYDYRKESLNDTNIDCDSFWKKDSNYLFVGQGKFNLWAQWAEIGIATAGTATEQLVGLGKPVLSLPGRGPQFTYGFAKRQSRLLGGSVLVCKNKQILARKLYLLMSNSLIRRYLGEIGRNRMGPYGGSFALARNISKKLFLNTTLSDI